MFSFRWKCVMISLQCQNEKAIFTYLNFIKKLNGDSEKKYLYIYATSDIKILIFVNFYTSTIILLSAVVSEESSTHPCPRQNSNS